MSRVRSPSPAPVFAHSVSPTDPLLVSSNFGAVKRIHRHKPKKSLRVQKHLAQCCLKEIGFREVAKCGSYRGGPGCTSFFRTTREGKKHELPLLTTGPPEAS